MDELFCFQVGNEVSREVKALLNWLQSVWTSLLSRHARKSLHTWLYVLCLTQRWVQWGQPGAWNPAGTSACQAVCLVSQEKTPLCDWMPLFILFICTKARDVLAAALGLGEGLSISGPGPLNLCHYVSGNVVSWISWIWVAATWSLWRVR